VRRAAEADDRMDERVQSSETVGHCSAGQRASRRRAACRP